LVILLVVTLLLCQLRSCRFFPAAMYLSTSKLAVAAVGNLSFAVALCMYNLVIKVCAARQQQRSKTHKSGCFIPAT
jgi:hypothetical protein